MVNHWPSFCCKWGSFYRYFNANFWLYLHQDDCNSVIPSIEVCVKRTFFSGKINQSPFFKKHVWKHLKNKRFKISPGLHIVYMYNRWNGEITKDCFIRATLFMKIKTLSDRILALIFVSPFLFEKKGQKNFSYPSRVSHKDFSYPLRMLERTHTTLNGGFLPLVGADF